MATYANTHFVLRFLGFFGASSSTITERWSTGLRLGLDDNAPAPTTGNLTGFLESISGPTSTFHASSAVRSGSNTFLSEMTIARVGLDGKYDPADVETTRRPYSPVISGTTSPILPWSSANVISLRTQFARGIASNGRTYWPTIGAAVASDTGRNAPAVVAAYVAAAVVWINAINAAAESQLGTGVRVIVAGQAGQKGPARNAYVTAIRCDDRLDAIERRENDVPPRYTTGAVTV